MSQVHAITDRFFRLTRGSPGALPVVKENPVTTGAERRKDGERQREGACR